MTAEQKLKVLARDVKTAIRYIENLSNYLNGWKLQELMAAETTLKASIKLLGIEKEDGN